MTLTEKSAAEEHAAPVHRRAIVLIPLLAFLGLAALFMIGWAQAIRRAFRRH